MNPSRSRSSDHCLALSRHAGLAALIVGGLVLLGWLLGFPGLTQWLPRFATMKPSSALCFALAGASLVLQGGAGTVRKRARTALACAFLAGLVALLALSEYIFGSSFGIETLLQPSMAGAVATRMPRATAFAFLLLAGGLLTLDAPWRIVQRVHQALSLLVALIGMLSLLEYAYGVENPFLIASHSVMALHSAGLFTLLGVAVLCARPDRGIMATLTSDHDGGLVARRILPVALTAPFLIGGLLLMGQRAGWYTPAFGLALFALSNVVMFGITVWLKARSINTLDEQRAQVEAALRKSEELFSLAFHANPAGMALQRVRDLMYVDVNASWLAMLGLERDEVIGRTSKELGLIAAEERAHVMRMLGEAGSFRDLELTLKSKRGRVCRALVSAQVVMVDSEPHALAVLLDVTARKEAEAAQGRLEGELRQSHKLQALGTLAAGIAHDFNNILAVVVGNTELARGDLPSDHPVQESLGEIHAAGMRASDLVRRILTFGRKRDAKRHVAQLQPILEEGLRLLQLLLPPNITIRTTYDSGAPDVAVDATQVHQIILNLGTNAAQAMGTTGGILDLELADVVVTGGVVGQHAELPDGRYARLTVRDSGAGMEPDVLERAFEPFFTTKAVGEGTGLGLSVVHGVMKNHDGAVTGISTPGAGSTFQLYFPASRTPAVDIRVPVRDVPRGHGEHVLFVDDEASLVHLGTRLLERLGYRVTSACSAGSALQLLQSRPRHFAALVTDLSMPGMSGTELATRVLAMRPAFPIVMCSGYVRPEDVASARRIGIAELILKPHSAQALGQALHRVLASPSHD